MITRPLDLSSRLRQEPRSFDWLYFVNGGLIVLFFTLFGSRHVLPPGLAVEFQLPEIAGANAGARATTHYVTVVNAGQIFAGDGLRVLSDLPEWLREQARTVRHPSLQIQASGDVEVSIITEISSAARRAGFTEIQVAATEPKTVRKAAQP
jgi:biopolymer transport protein ExbD